MNWNNILSSDCTVCKLGPRMVYPIFRCGFTSIRATADKNKVEVEDTWNLIAQNKLINKHFAPQYVWLMHLQKFHKGTVTLYPFKDIKKFTKKHTHKWSTLSATEKEPVAQIEEFVDKDFLLLKYLNKTLTIKELLKNVLS